MAVLLRIYDLAEFNRFGLTREMVLAEIVDYLGDAQAAAEVAASAAADGDAGLTGEKSLQEFASWLLRRLAESGWIEREQSADYTEYIILPDYAFTLLEAFRAIGQQRPREYTGQLYAAHQLLTSEHEEFSPALAVTQAYENVRGLVRGLNELNQNIRRYTERVTKDKSGAGADADAVRRLRAGAGRGLPRAQDQRPRLALPPRHRQPAGGVAAGRRLARPRGGRPGPPTPPHPRPGRARDQPRPPLHRRTIGRAGSAAG